MNNNNVHGHCEDHVPAAIFCMLMQIKLPYIGSPHTTSSSCIMIIYYDVRTHGGGGTFASMISFLLLVRALLARCREGPARNTLTCYTKIFKKERALSRQ